MLLKLCKRLRLVLPKEAVKQEDSGGCYYAKEHIVFLQIIALQIFCNTKITKKNRAGFFLHLLMIFLFIHMRPKMGEAQFFHPALLGLPIDLTLDLPLYLPTDLTLDLGHFWRRCCPFWP